MEKPFERCLGDMEVLAQTAHWLLLAEMVAQIIRGELQSETAVRRLRVLAPLEQSEIHQQSRRPHLQLAMLNCPSHRLATLPV